MQGIHYPIPLTAGLLQTITITELWQDLLTGSGLFCNIFQVIVQGRHLRHQKMHKAKYCQV